MKCTIQQATFNDYPSIRRIVKKAFHSYYPEIETKKWIYGRIKEKFYYIIKKNRRLIGLMCLENEDIDKLHIEALVVLSKYQRQGLGKAFIRRAISRAKRINAHRSRNGKTLIRKITVHSDDNYKAKDFYFKAGFEQTEEGISNGRKYRDFEMRL